MANGFGLEIPGFFVTIKLPGIPIRNPEYCPPQLHTDRDVKEPEDLNCLHKFLRPSQSGKKYFSRVFPNNYTVIFQCG